MSRLSDFISTGSQGGGNGIYSFIEKAVNTFRLDTVNDGLSRGSVFGLIESIDFESSNVGSAYISFKMPDGFDYDKDIKIKHIASLNSVDSGKLIVFRTESWLIDSGDVPSTADSNVLSAIQSQDNHMGTLEIISIPEIIIPSSLIIGTDQFITLKLTREALDASDTYSGSYQLIAIQVYQD